ncbi:MAG: phytanoyl-CoA dioxygenase family protein [Bdellovibrionaceae bacterium]|nr:phytanoyl-CoA dioxygenase family protein [Pseudobdellovibrionaceae bacterium]
MNLLDSQFKLRPISQDEQETQKYNILTRGFDVIPNFLPLPLCSKLCNKLQSAVSEFSPVPNSARSHLDRHQLHDLITYDLDFAGLLEDARLQPLIGNFLGKSWIMYAATSSSIPPNGTNYSNRIHIDSPRFQLGYAFNLGVIWVLSDYTEDNGALEVLPGSHHVEDSPSESHFNNNAQKVICKAGSLITFHARLWHRTGANRSDAWRHSMTMNCCRSFMKQRMDWVHFVKPEISSQLNEQARRLIGFDTRLPKTLEEFFVPEDQRLYKANQG